MSDRLEVLEMKLSYHEQTIDELNQVLCKQQNQIDRLNLICDALTERVKEWGGGASGSDDADSERPPHY